ncbi:hypothetical protein AMTRI_Chr04g246730 [Amborella trichopoda]
MVAERVQGLALAGLDKLPPQFIRPLNERPENSKALTGLHVPTVSFSPDCKQAAKGSEEWGIFQLTDHGISPELFRRLKEAGEGFFSLPQEYKEQYANDFAGGVFEGYGTKLAKNPDQKLEWIDYFFHFMWPTSRVNYDKWPKSPLNYREVTEEYGEEMKRVAEGVLEALSVGLGLEAGALKEALGGEEMSLEMKINLYPPCPQPELALGVEAHTDMSALTILLPNQVPGLQVIKDGSWVSVDYVPDALVVHVGDQIEVNSRTYPCACPLIFFFFFFLDVLGH